MHFDIIVMHDHDNTIDTIVTSKVNINIDSINKYNDNMSNTYRTNYRGYIVQ